MLIDAGPRGAPCAQSGDELLSFRAGGGNPIIWSLEEDAGAAPQAAARPSDCARPARASRTTRAPREGTGARGPRVHVFPPHARGCRRARVAPSARRPRAILFSPPRRFAPRARLRSDARSLVSLSCVRLPQPANAPQRDRPAPGPHRHLGQRVAHQDDAVAGAVDGECFFPFSWEQGGGRGRRPRPAPPRAPARFAASDDARVCSLRRAAPARGSSCDTHTNAAALPRVPSSTSSSSSSCCCARALPVPTVPARVR